MCEDGALIRLKDVVLNKLHRLFIGTTICLMLSGCSFGDTMEKIAQKTYNVINDNQSSTVDDYSKEANESIQDNDAVEQSDSDFDTEKKSIAKPAMASTIQVYDTSGTILEKEVEVYDETENADDANSDADDLKDYSSELTYCYAYSQLSDEEKNTYNEIYSILKDMKKNVFVTSTDPNQIDLAFKCIIVDHPELFYVKGYSIGKYTKGSKIDKISIGGTYTMSKQEVEAKQPEIDKYVTNVIDSTPLGDDYTRIKYVYEYLVKNVEYDENAPNNQNILSVIENGRTVCQGYAKMMQIILNKMGIFCTLVNGTAKGGAGGSDQYDDGNNNGWSRHVWNIVKSNGQYYNVDTTWGDAAFVLMDENTDNPPVIDINYEYFMLDDEAFRVGHRADPVVKMPVCNSTDDNFYNREGCYYTSVDEIQLQKMFDSAFANGEIVVNIKASSDEVYEELREHLITEHKIFDYISNDNIKYVEYPKHRLMLISL